MPDVTPSRRPSVLAAPLALGLTVVLAACGSGGGSGGSGGAVAAGSATGVAAAGSTGAAPVSGGVSRVSVTATQEGGKDVCRLDHPSAAAGPVTFTVANTDSTGVTEVELLSDARILGEKENLAPGLAPVTFTVTLGGGTYQLYCPGADPETQTFTVTGAASAAPTGSAGTLLAAGTTEYASYVTSTLGDFRTAVGTLRQAVDRGDVRAARTAYAAARPFYEKVESDVEGFVEPGTDPTSNKGNLDYLVDMRASNLDPTVGWTGMHAIERDLWQGGAITPQTKAYAAALVSNVDRLVALAPSLEYKPEDLANGAAGLLEEVQSGKITGEEEQFSHLDLVDFSANVEGAQQAFSYLQPGLEKIDPALTEDVAKQFALVRDTLAGYRDAGDLGGFRPWTAQLRATDAATLSKAVQGLQEPLSRIAEKVATAR